MKNWIVIFTDRRTGSPKRTATITAPSIVAVAKMAEGQCTTNEEVTRILKA